MRTLFEREMQDEQTARLFAQEQLIEEATELIAATMHRQGIPKSELAHRIGTSKANVTQLLAGSRNMTLRTFADLMYAMGERVLLTSTGAAEANEVGTICWAVRAPRPSRAYTWEDSEIFVGRAGHAA